MWSETENEQEFESPLLEQFLGEAMPAPLTHGEGGPLYGGELDGHGYEPEAAAFEYEAASPAAAPACHCGCRAGEAEAYEALEQEQGESPFAPEMEAETGRDCGVDCLAVAPNVLPKGRKEGAFVERTAGDPNVNLALQLFDYDVNAYQPIKPKHAEALGRVSEFISRRLAQTSQGVAVTITGLASRTGTGEYNLNLSCKRAKCVADNIRSTFSPAARARVKIDIEGQGFTRSECRGRECELGEWRSVLVQVHAPGDPPVPIPPIDPGWDKYRIRCCSFQTEKLAEGLLGDLLKKGIPNLPPALRGKMNGIIKKALGELTKFLGKNSRVLSGLLADVSVLLSLFPASFIREKGVFEVLERDRFNARKLTLCYSGMGLRIDVPNDLDGLLDDVLNKNPALKALPEFVKKEIKAMLNTVIPASVRRFAQPIASDTPGAFVDFDLAHPRNLRIFEGGVQMGEGIWMPGEVNVQFDSGPWNAPDPKAKPRIARCPGTECNAGGVQMKVGDGKGFEFFAITAGQMVPGSCVCAVGQTGALRVARQPLARSGALREAEGEEASFAESLSEGEGELETGGFEAGELDRYAPLRAALAPEHAGLQAGELRRRLGGRAANVALYDWLNSASLRQATLAGLLGRSGRRTVIVEGAVVSIPAYFRALARLCDEAAESLDASPDR